MDLHAESCQHQSQRCTLASDAPKDALGTSKRLRLQALNLATALAFSASLGACSAQRAARFDPGELRLTGDSCAEHAECASGLCAEGKCDTAAEGNGFETGGLKLSALEIEPAEVTLIARDGSRPNSTFTVTGIDADGERISSVPVAMHFTAPEMGNLDAQTGHFDSNGIVGGTGFVVATFRDSRSGQNHEARARVTVRIERTATLGNAPADAAARFKSPAPTDTTAATMVYPLDGAVVPENVVPMTVQWQHSTTNDLFQITVSKPNLIVQAYAKAEPGTQNAWQPDADTWRAIASSDPGSEAEIRVDRWIAASNTAVMGTPRRIKFVRTSLDGSVYYWDVAAGRIMRIDDGAKEAVSFMPTPPLDKTNSQRCVGCHSVSPSGRYMVGRLGGGNNIGAIFDLTQDLTGANPPTRNPLSRDPSPSLNWWFSTWSPDEERLAVTVGPGDASQQLRLVNARTGALVNHGGTAPSGVTHPAWSPDGKQVAVIRDIDTWGGHPSVGNLALIDLHDNDVFGSMSTLHTASTLGGTVDCYPTWTPDSQRLAFGHGSFCSSGAGSSSALYVIDRDGTGVQRLANASPGERNFQPRFSPFTTGEYYWLSFLSRRPYGNDAAGTGSSGVAQIWIAAIKRNPAPGEDPSEVPYWLPGQRTVTSNIAAYWAKRACREEGSSCAAGSECCSGHCADVGGGVFQCVPEPDGDLSCTPSGQSCTSDASCCSGLRCNGGTCLDPLT